jgi:hypothetical protein
MKLVSERPFAKPETAACQLLQLAPGIDPVQDGRTHIEKINYPFLYTLKASGAEFGAAPGAQSRRAGWSCMRAALLCGS